MIEKFIEMFKSVINHEFNYRPKDVIPVWIALYIFVFASLWMSIRIMDVAHVIIDGVVWLRMTVAGIIFMADWFKR